MKYEHRLRLLCNHLPVEINAFADGFHVVLGNSEEVIASPACKNIPTALPLSAREGEGKLHLSVEDREISVDSAGNFWLLGGGDNLISGILARHLETQPSCSFFLDEKDEIYGLGEKSGFLNKRGERWRMWNTDQFNHGAGADPLYVSVSFALLWNGKRAVGIFVDSMAESIFDAGSQYDDQLQISVHDTFMDYYILLADSPSELVRIYANLTGTMTLPPLWSLGYHQSRYSYFPDLKITQLAHEFRKRKIPCDVIYLDIHYMHGFRVFSWDKERFSHPEKLLKDLEEKGFQVITIVDPAIKQDEKFEVYIDGCNKNVFCCDESGEIYRGEVWPEESVFPDFGQESTRHWWAEWHKENLGRGVSGIWNDMNEPANFSVHEDREEVGPTVPNSVLMNYKNHKRSMRYYHNAYALLMAQSTHEAFERYKPDKRPFVLTRAGSAGIQRYAAVWTGDNTSYWEHMADSIPTLLGMGLSGLSFVGADVGGFQGNASPELFARWMAMACFIPFFRGHSMIASRAHEPWAFGKRVEDICRFFICLRYRLLPLIYTLCETSSRIGDPIMRPLLYHYPHDSQARAINDQFLLGSDLMIAPITRPATHARAVYLPEGEWYDGQGEKQRGGKYHLCETPLEVLPLFFRAGSMLILEDERQHTQQKRGDLTIYLFPDSKGEAKGSIYDDSGQGFDYQKGWYCRLSFVLKDNMLCIRHEAGNARALWKKAVVAAFLPSQLSALDVQKIAPPLAQGDFPSPGEKVYLSLKK